MYSENSTDLLPIGQHSAIHVEQLNIFNLRDTEVVISIKLVLLKRVDGFNDHLNIMIVYLNTEFKKMIRNAIIRISFPTQVLRCKTINSFL